ncbi:MAG: NAD(P)-binding protein [Dehalococcoidia bacterium]|nr:NAD(P)-binding protein [Dehalococcoidia bacterium]
MRSTDVLVIGSGFGGLSAGALAAASGLEVVVAEQHSRPGGCAGDFALDGWWFPAGATVVTGLEPGGILRQVFEASKTPFQSEPLDPSIELNVSGQKLRYVADHDAWLDEFVRAFPNAGPGYRRFWEWVERTGGAMYRAGNGLPSFPIESASDVRRSLPVVSPGAMRVLPDMVRTVAAVKQRLGATGCADADALIDGLLMDATGATAETCSAAQGALALDIYRRGCQWVEGGTATLAMGLVRSIRRQGGEVRFLSRVTRLLPGRNGWRAVFDDGSAIEARSGDSEYRAGSAGFMLGNGAKTQGVPDSRRVRAAPGYRRVRARGDAPVPAGHRRLDTAAPRVAIAWCPSSRARGSGWAAGPCRFRRTRGWRRGSMRARGKAPAGDTNSRSAWSMR